MKTAFSLLESIVVISLLGIFFLLLFEPMKNLYNQQLQNQKQAQTIANANSTLILLDKFLQKCLKFQETNSIYSCYLKDDDNIIQILSNETKLIASSLFIQDKNLQFYSPQSSFSNIATNQANLLGKDAKNLLFLNVLNGEIYESLVLDENKINHDFEKQPLYFYKILQGKIEIFLENRALYMNFENKNKILLMQDLSSFEISKDDNLFKIKICLTALPNLCFEKWSKP